MPVFGIDIGGTKCAVSLQRDDGKVEEVARFATASPGESLRRLSEEVAKLEPGPEPLFGISCGGPLDSGEGLILSPPNLPGWDRIAICDHFRNRFGGQAFLMNDANACALAEWQFGAGRGCRNMVFLTAGTGMGAGLILDGRLYEGTTGDAGEVGHMRLEKEGPVGYGKAGSFEGFCSGGGIERLAKLRLAGHRGPVPEWAAPSEKISTKAIAEAAARGDKLALDILSESGRRLGQALALLIDILNPERVVMGGIFPRCGQLLRPGMEETLRQEALSTPLSACAIVPAELGETIGSHGAISVALYKGKASPG
jgi:glucokinase